MATEYPCTVHAGHRSEMMRLPNDEPMSQIYSGVCSVFLTAPQNFVADRDTTGARTI